MRFAFFTLLPVLIWILILPSQGAEILVPDDYSSIQDAIDSSSDGDTIVVRDGLYSVYLQINRSISLRSENGSAGCILEASTNDDVIEVHADNVSISGFTIRNGNDDGVDVEPDPVTSDPSDHVNISDNVFYSLYGGIQLEDSNSSVIMNNSISSVTEGIYYVGASYSNLIVNNTISNSSYGISIFAGDGSVIYLNKLINNSLHARDCGDNSWNSTEMQDYTYQGNAFTNHTGNYWDDYVGIDANGDGIGDTPYNISDELCGEGGGGGGPIPIGGFASSQSKDYYPMLFETSSPPQISNIQESNLTSSSITISWDVSLVSNNRILYSLNSDLSSPTWSEWDNNTANPSITLSGLLANTTYHYSVYSYRTDNASIYSNSSIRNFTTIRSPKTWYVDDDGLNCSANFTSIQDAVNASIDGDTIIVCNGSYNENIFVNRSLNITGLANPVVDAGYNGSAFTLASNANTIQGFTIKNTSFFGPCYGSIPEAGVRVGYTTYQVVGAGDCTQITDHESTDNVIRNNLFVNSGIVLVKGYIQSGSDRNTITNNTFNASRIEMKGSSYNNITSNTFRGETHYGYISIEGFSYRSARHNLIHANTFTKHYESTMPMVSMKSYASHTNISNNILTGYGGISVSSGDCVIMDNRIGGFTPVRENDNGILINHASNCLIINNSVKDKYAGIKIDSSSSSAFSTNLTLRSNKLQSNTYDFYFNPGKVQDFTNSPNFLDFDHDIDLSNNVSGGAIYFLKNVSNAVFDQTTQPTIGFFACVNCENVTVRGIGLSSNSYGILLYNTSDSVMDSMGAYYNHLAGVAVYHSNNITITNSRFEENGRSNYASGIYIGASESITLENDEINSNWCYGLELESSNNSTILSSNITDNGPSYYVPPASNDCYPNGIGIKMYGSNNNTIKTNHIRAVVVPKQGTWKGGQGYGIHSTSSSANLIYNNYLFNHSVNAYDTGINRWNITKTAGVNIIGGPYLGGNYWHDYAGMDTAGGDGLGDTLLPYNSSGNIQNGGDYHPLTGVVTDTTAPSIHVVSPAESETYSANYIYLEVYSPDPDVHRWWYSLNGGANVTFTPNTTISGLTNGNYSLTVFVNDTAGNINSTTVNFSVSITAGGGVGGGFGGGIVSETPLGEVTQPDFEITILTPESEEYLERSLQLSFASPLPLLRASLIVDGGNAESISIPAFATSGSAEITRLHLGKHRIIVNGEDYYGRKGRGEVEFEIIPLTLGEINVTGTQTTPRFADDVAFSFYGRSTNYTLRFEAKGEARIDIYVNEYLRNHIQSYNNLTGKMIYSFAPTSAYQTYEVPISAESITADVENLLSFVSENAGDGGGGEKSWEVRNVTLIPAMPFSLPQITVFTFDKAISENESLTAYLKLDGVASESEYKAYIYLITPEGKKLYYPDWSEAKKPIDPYYLRTNYYGRLPSVLYFTNFTPGTYILVGEVDSEFNAPVSLSTDKAYYSDERSVKVYISRSIFFDNQQILIEQMLSGDGENGTLILSMEDPNGKQIYLPMLSENQEGVDYSPIKSDYFIAFSGIIDSSWAEGSYVVRSKLYNSSALIAEDIQTFEVCRKQATITGSYLRLESDNDTSAFILSRIRLIDFYTLESQEREFTGEHYSFSLTASPGKYYLAGEAYSKDGKVYRIPPVKVSVGCGKNQTRNVELDFIGSINLSSYRYSGASSFSIWKPKYLSLEKKTSGWSLEEKTSGCSKPKVFVTVGLDEGAIELLQSEKEYGNATAEDIKRTLSVKLAQMLKGVSSNVEIFSYGETAELLDGVRSYLEENPGSNPDTSRLSPIRQIEYIYRAEVFAPVSSHYEFFITVYLTERATHKIVLGPVRLSGSYDVEDDLSVVVNHYGDIGKIIEAWESSHPLPPRDPKMYITVIPGSVSVEERNAEIKITVTDCRDRAIPDGYAGKQKVFLQKNTERGGISDSTGIVAGGSQLTGIDNYVISYVGKGSVAKAKYKLTKGIEAGEDRFEVITFGRGMKKVSKVKTIRIDGVRLKAIAEKDDISPTQSTFVRISLYEESEEGGTSPLAGKPIKIGRVQLLDGKLIPVGSLDAYGNPVTDENGIVKLKFIAGKKEGLVKIPVRYQTELGEVRDTALIKVREREFVLLISHTGTSVWSIAGTNTHQSSCQVLCCPENDCRYSTASYSGTSSANRVIANSYHLTSKTFWKQGTNEEKTTATYTRTAHISLERTKAGSSSRCDESGTYSSSYQYSLDGSISSHVVDKLSSIVIELRNGDLLLVVDPIQRPVFLMEGSHTESYSKSWQSSWSSSDGSGADSGGYSGTNNCQYDGDTSTDPEDSEGCFKRWFGERYLADVPYSWMTHKPALILKKIGKDKWEDITVDYSLQHTRSGSGSSSYFCDGVESYSSTYQSTGEYHLEVKVVRR